jgi:hypothetical protein
MHFAAGVSVSLWSIQPIGSTGKLKTGNYLRNFKYLKGASGDKNNGV